MTGWRNAARARRADERFAVLVLGLDRFGGVNEMFGHATGENSLRMFAERMRGFVRETDTVARLGSDQFVVLVTASPRRGAFGDFGTENTAVFGECF